MRLIDADALLKKLPREELVSRMIVAGMPTIEAEIVRRGRWVEIDYPVSECSVCKYMVDTLSIATSYCPNCGAKMEVEE